MMARSRSTMVLLTLATLGLLLAACGSAPGSPSAAGPEGSFASTEAPNRPGSSTTDSADGADRAASDRPRETDRSPTASPLRSGPEPLPAQTARVVGLEMPRIGLAANRLEKLRLLPDGSLAAPKNPGLAGWYGDGPLPGELGPAIVAGHVDSKVGAAVFARLSELQPGDNIIVAVSDAGTARRRVRFVVDRLVHVSKQEFPTDEVYGTTPDAQLRLITCSGPYDRVAGSYDNNTVVFATASAER